MAISRRGFLIEGGSLLGAAALGRIPVPRIGRRAQAKRVLVIGAGAAGLCAAYELDRAGHDVLVLEARMYPGGRIHTVREPFADGLHAEAGAMFLLEAHTLTMHYARELGVTLLREPRPSADRATVFHVAGQRILVRMGEVVNWPLELNPGERGKPIGALKTEYWYSKIGAVDGLLADDWPRPAHLEYDRVTLGEYWRRQGASDAAVRLMALGYPDGWGDGVESYSALSAMRDEAALNPPGPGYRVEGGSDLLPRALATRLGQRVRYGSPVVAVRQDAEGVAVTVEDARGRHEVSGDFAICTVPLPVMRRIAFTPALSAVRRRAMAEIPSTSITRVYLQCRERFWESEGLAGLATTDLPIHSVFHSTQGQPGPRGILEAYAAGPRARRLGGMRPEQRTAAVIREMAKVHPRIAEYVEGSASVVWDDDPWALGDFAYFRPGQIEAFFPHVQLPEGRIHFAGDTIGAIPGWIQGAFLSARRAVQRINESA